MVLPLLPSPAPAQPAGRGVPVIALVTSRGGLAALTDVLGPLSPGIPACLLALQHQSPAGPSLLTQILATRCALPVHAVAHGEPLRVGTVGVAPPGFHLLVTPQRTLALVRSGSFPPSRPSADLLLTSMALSLGADAVAVVLSGGGTDGATGACAVHDFGGFVLTSDEQSSQDFDMPTASITRDHAVDRVLPVGDIPAALEQLAAERRSRGLQPRRTGT